MKIEHISALMAATLFAIGAVVVIIMQHNQATANVLAAVNGTGTVGGGSFAVGGALGTSASLAGSPTAGQAGSSSTPAVVPLNAGAGWQIS